MNPSQEEYDALQTNTQNLRKVHDELIESITKLTQQKSDLEYDMVRLENGAKSLIATIDDHKERSAANEEKIDEQGQVILNTNKTIDQLERRKSDLEDELVVLEGNYASRTDEEKKKLEATIAPIRSQLEVLAEEKASLTDRIIKATETLTAVQKDNRELAEKKKTAEQELAGVLVKLTNAKTELDKVTGDITKEVDEFNKLVDERDELKENIKKLNEDIRLKKEEASMVISDIEKQTKEAGDELTKVKAQYETEKRKLFTIADRERAVSQREEFIRAKYQEAGIDFL